MALSYWGWQGDQLDAAAFLKPNDRDKNVMPYEMEEFVEQETGLQAVVRFGGDLETLKRFVAAGFPVVIEKGFEGERFDGWMGHYEVVTGYDEAKSEFLVYDSYVGPETDFGISYDEIANYWRAFNYVYLVSYPPDRSDEVMTLLGDQADEVANYQYAAQKAANEIYALTGRDQYFAWYNRGSSLVKLQDYAGAADAYDQAFALYPSIPEKQRPWRMLWYQTGPYFAYYYTGRYYDVINLATTTIGSMSEPAIEESFYWRGLAEAALGDTTGAIEDYRTSLKWHPGFGPSLAQLQLLGVEP
jgi:tetratricopeptide (TPR) repeat protein